MEATQDSKDLLRFLGMVIYLAKWIPNLSEKTELLRDLTKQNVPWIWSPEIDSSMNGLSTILFQHCDDKWCPVSYASHSSSKCRVWWWSSPRL